MLGLLGDEWTLLIIQQALLGATRYGEFMARLPISNSVLASRLRALTDDRLLLRNVSRAGPVRTDYLVTPRSRSLWPALLSIWEWERHWVPEHAERLPSMHHNICRSDFAPVLVCRSCDEVTTDKDVVARWGPSGSWTRSVPEAVTRRRSDSDHTPIQAGLFPETMSVFGNRWAAALLIAAFQGATRFTEFQGHLGAPPSLLADRLQTFCANEVLMASSQATRPDWVTYTLTEKGRAFFPVLITSLQWAQQWFHAPEGPAVLVTHRACGEPFAGILVCDHCTRPLSGAQITASRTD